MEIFAHILITFLLIAPGFSLLALAVILHKRATVRRDEAETFISEAEQGYREAMDKLLASPVILVR